MTGQALSESDEQEAVPLVLARSPWAARRQGQVTQGRWLGRVWGTVLSICVRGGGGFYHKQGLSKKKKAARERGLRVSQVLEGSTGGEA